MRVRKAFIAPMAAVGLALAIAAPAAAEGSWTSYISGANTGFLSRVWTDMNNDSTSTNIYFTGCSDPYAYVSQYGVKVSVYRQVIGIDPSVGTQTLCDSTPTGYYGDLQASDYRFKLGTAYDLDVSYVRVRY